MKRIRHVSSIICLLALLTFFILAQEGSGKLEIMNCLQDSPIQIWTITLTCNSAGAYYYGKSSYRDSSTCKYGDNAHITAYLELQRDFTNDNLLVSVDSGVYGIMSPAIESAEFCRISSLSTATNDDDAANNNNDDGNDAECPIDGFYSLQTSFTVSSFEVDQNLHYIPDLRLILYNETGTIVGCAQTGTIATFNNSTMHAEMGMMALGIALLVLGTCFGLMLYLTYRRKKRLEREMMEMKLKQGVPYSYVRTTSLGRVPISGRRRSDKSHSSSDV